MDGVDWGTVLSFLSVVTVVVSAIVGAAVVYLRLFVRNEINTASRNLTDAFDGKFMTRELAESKWDKAEAEFKRIATRLRKLEEMADA